MDNNLEQQYHDIDAFVGKMCGAINGLATDLKKSIGEIHRQAKEIEDLKSSIASAESER